MLAWKTQLALQGLVKNLPIVPGSGQAGLKPGRQFAVFISLAGWDPGPAAASRDTLSHIPWGAGAAPVPVASPARAWVRCKHSWNPSGTAELTANTDPHPPPRASLTLLSLQMHSWEACRVAAASWSRTLQSAPFSTLCCPVLCINLFSGKTGLQTSPVLSDLGVFVP